MCVIFQSSTQSLQNNRIRTLFCPQKTKYFLSNFWKAQVLSSRKSYISLTKVFSPNMQKELFLTVSRPLAGRGGLWRTYKWKPKTIEKFCSIQRVLEWYWIQSTWSFVQEWSCYIVHHSTWAETSAKNCWCVWVI